LSRGSINATASAVTLWTYYEVVAADMDLPGAYADVLQRLHTGMRNVEIATPHFLDRVAEAERLVTQRDETPALAAADRHLLLRTLHSARERIHSRSAAEQLLHGEPHPGNLLSTRDGPLFIDFETCCRGPIEFDVAHMPEEVSARYPDVDQVLLAQCRLVLAMVAAWRWDIRDEFPNRHQHGRDILSCLIVLTAGRVATWLADRPVWIGVQRWFMATVLGALAIRMVTDRARPLPA
jgi:aminoglycoside phosphotransferase (APT) family kinase protein